MGLQVWLPLNGDLENKGLSEVTFTTTGTPLVENGKIGKCYTFNEDSYFTSNETFLEGKQQYSLCAWFKSSYNGTHWKRIIGLGNHSRVQLDIAPTTSKVRFFVSKDGTESNYEYVFSKTTVYDGQWHHVCGTFDNGKLVIYIDGVLETSKIVDSTAFTSTNARQLTIGAVTNDVTKFVGSINDVRLYDEALSLMQIKLISQGLVAHYLLNNNNGGLPNILKGVPRVYSKTGYTVYHLEMLNNFEVGKTYTVQFWNINVSHTGKTADELGMSVYWGGGSISLFHFIGTNYFTNGHADYLTATFTITEAQAEKSGATNPWLVIFNSVPYADGTKYLSIGHWKLEEGSKPTPWSSYVDDTTNIEYDVSGYCHNGTKHNITEYTSDSPRYSLATKFNGTNSYINVGRGGMVKDEITINLWGYMDDWTNYNGKRFISCTEGGGWNFESVSNGIRFSIGTGTTSNTYVTGVPILYTDLSAGWHMFTGVYDGFDNKIYLDGNYYGKTSKYTTKTPVHYHNSNDILIGAEASSSHSPTGAYFNGYISDIRIYATALSDADILSLYNNSAFLDSSGNMYATEYIEE